jgi:hypothetical protein
MPRRRDSHAVREEKQGRTGGPAHLHSASYELFFIFQTNSSLQWLKLYLSKLKKIK